MPAPTTFGASGRTYRIWSGFIAIASLAGLISWFPLFFPYWKDFLLFVDWRAPVLIFAFCGLTALFFILTIWFGVSVWLHRLLTHLARNTYPWTKVMLGIVASMAGQGHSRDWVARHRQHHAESDDKGDPHSPVYGFAQKTGDPKSPEYIFPNRLAKLKGFWHAQNNWIFKEDKEPIDYARWIADLLEDKTVWFVDRFYFVWVAFGLILSACIGGFITYGLYEFFWYGLLLGFVSALGRMFLGYQSTFLVNSYGHLYGVRKFYTGDNSRNPVTLLGYILMVFNGGELPQNNHHRFQRSARIGFTKWETRLDMGWHIIRFFDRCGITSEKNEPTEAQIAKYEIVPVAA